MEQQQKLKDACMALIVRDNVNFDELEIKHYRQMANKVGLSLAEVIKMLSDMEQQWKAYRELVAEKDSAVILKNDYFISQANSKFWKNATKAKKSFLEFRYKPLSGLDYAAYTIIFSDREQNLIEGYGDSEEVLMRKSSSARGSGSLGKRKWKSDSASPSSQKMHERDCVGFCFCEGSTSNRSDVEEVIEHLIKLGKSPNLPTLKYLMREDVRKAFHSLKDESSKLQFLLLLGVK